ncbi:MAG: Hpt domain-containing protein [Rhizobiales bacterium]|nr:Hpt domain-containing protein [Hyphomicrobiales bacterium]
MAKVRPKKPSVATFGDYEMITPANELRKAVSEVADRDSDDPVARAEDALAQLSSEFSAWMDSESDRLDAVRRSIKSTGFNKTTRDALFRAAHDIKGEAATFGYPFVASSADSLCRLIEHTPEMDRIPTALVDRHVDAIRAIIREKARPDIVEIADALTTRLREVADHFLAHENRDRPDVLAGILTPPIAPSEQTV